MNAMKADPNIRLATVADAPGIHAIYAPMVRDTAISFELEPPAVETMAKRISATLATYPWLVWEQGGRIAGYAYGSKHRERPAYQWSAEVTAYVHPDFHRRGIGGALYRVLLALFRAQGFCNAYAIITLPNAGSVALHESAGFTHLATYRGVGYKLGRWHDIGLFEQRLCELPATPRPPRPISEVWDPARLQPARA
jgi:L-amino acid N-acyltransferase YncA